MDLLSVFKRKTSATVVPAPETADAVQLARTRARRRLIGAAVLIVVGIIGFPLLFETQPRPIPVDLPIEIPRKDGLAPLAMPGPQPERRAPTVPLPNPPASPMERVITETQEDAGREVAPTPPPSASAPPAEPAKASQAASTLPASAPPAAAPPPARASEPKAAKPAANDGARAKALLEGRSTGVADSPLPAASAGRFVVQVGAFTEPAAVKEARAKVERLGLKTYTQVADTPAGPRTRVRAGPFATREEAERAAARIKAAAMPTVILAL